MSKYRTVLDFAVKALGTYFWEGGAETGATAAAMLLS